MTHPRVLIPALFLAVGVSAAAADRDVRKIEITSVSPNTLKILIDRTTRDSSPPTYHVEIRVPRSQPLVRASEFRSYYSFTRHTASWTSWQRTRPPFGYILFTRDTRGDALEVRIVELEDKHDYVPSGVNGINRVKVP
jgi:hypothetical protein